MTSLQLAISLSVSVLAAYAAHLSAKRKGRSQAWAVISLFLTPALLILLFLPNKKIVNEITPPIIVNCEACKGPVSSAARNCPHCGHQIGHFVDAMPNWTRFIEGFSGIVVVITLGVALWSLSQIEAASRLPSCDSSYGENMVIRAVADAPIGKVLGLGIISFRSTETIKSTADEVKCRAVVNMNNGQMQKFSYRFYPENGITMVRAQLEDETSDQ